ncbi:hypothetical protein [Solibacillus sp. NPDC093137]|uniref:hypothetical protein n=1 Tax=Solibacillus sp. NPDC093137 TaxID=3390678 RepID=UPI003D02E7AE
MKITDYIIVFLIVALPAFFFIQMKAEKTTDFVEMNHHNEWSLTVSAHDAINVLSTNVVPKLEAGYHSYKISPSDPQLAYETFIHSLAANYQVQDGVSVNVLERYVPVFAVLDYDGLLLNVYKEYKDADGNVINERTWLPKIPFSYTDSEGNIINFTIDDTVEIYDSTLKEWYDGKRGELAADEEITIPLLKDEDTFEKERTQMIVNTLQENIAYYVNKHNVYTKSLDVTYTFTMPLIEKEDWYNTVDNIGVFAFFQGYQYMLNDQQYNEFAFVGTRLDRKDRIMAGIVDGHKRFWYESCNFPYQATELYSSKKDAAKNGYSELSCVNQYQ